jgi:WD40 repeat protein
MQGQQLRVNSVAFTPDGKRLLAIAQDQSLCVYDASSGEPALVLRDQGETLARLAVSPDNFFVAACARWRKRLRVLDGRPWPVVLLGREPAAVWCVAHAPGGRTLAWGSAQGRVCLLDTRSATPRHRFQAHAGIVRRLSFSPDGRKLATAGGDRLVKLWDVTTGRLESELAGHTGAVEAALWAPDGRTLITAGADGDIRLWDVADARELAVRTAHPSPIYCLALAGDGRALASAGLDRTIKLHDIAPDRGPEAIRELSSWKAHEALVADLVFAPAPRAGGSSLLVSAGWDGKVKLWDTATSKVHKVLPVGKTFHALAFSPDGRTLAVGPVSGRVKLLDLAAGGERVLREQTVGRVAVSLAPDGAALITAGADGRVRRWPLKPSD